MRLIFALLLLMTYNFSFSQQSESILKFAPTFNDLPLVLDKNYQFKSDSLKITSLKYYISNINCYFDDQLIETFPTDYHLIDFENPATATLKLPRTNAKAFNRISFCVGIDSLTNESGAIGGDLDPTKGMYWTWQSGYINLKLEGQSKICPSRNNLFIFHVGGYQYPYTSIQTLDFSIKDQQKFTFNIDISKLMNELNLSEVYEVMSPSKKALSIAQQFSSVIKVVE